MKLGIVGLSGSGKTTVFEALTGSRQEGGHSMDARIGTIRVPDTRIDVLSEMYHRITSYNVCYTKLLRGTAPGMLVTAKCTTPASI